MIAKSTMLATAILFTENTAEEPLSKTVDDSQGVVKPSAKKRRKRDWYLYHAYSACTVEEDMDKCRTYASFAQEQDPGDETAAQLLEIAIRGGGERTVYTKKKKDFGPRQTPHLIGVGVLTLVAQDAHNGYLVTPEYGWSFSGKKIVYLLGIGIPLGQIHFLKSEDPELVGRPSPTFAGGGRFHFQVGRRFRISWHSTYSLHADMGVGFLATGSDDSVRNLFFHLTPGAGMTYRLGRFALGLMGSISWLMLDSDATDKQGLGVGFLSQFSIGF